MGINGSSVRFSYNKIVTVALAIIAIRVIIFLSYSHKSQNTVLIEIIVTLVLAVTSARVVKIRICVTTVLTVVQITLLTTRTYVVVQM